MRLLLQLVWPLRRKDKREQNEEERVEEGLLLLVNSLEVRASGGIGSPAQAESNSHVCQCVTAPAAQTPPAAQQERCHHPDRDRNQDQDQDQDLPQTARR
jgi:hypothetical protein